MLRPAEEPTTVAIFGEDSVVGNALESLLRFADYGARFFPEYPGAAAESLEGAKVALILPPSSHRRGTELIARIRAHPATTDLRVIELIAVPNGEQSEHTRLPWPSSLEGLKRGIEAALLEEPGRHEPTET